MKIVVSMFICFSLIALSCTDRDDNLEGVQIRVLNATASTYREIVIDSLFFVDVQPDELPFYQKYEGTTLPDRVLLSLDSLVITVTADSIFEIDSTKLNLFTYRIYDLADEMGAKVEILKD